MAGTKRAKTDERETATEDNASEGAAKKPLRPSQCRGYMRRELAKHFEGIVEGFVKGARSGSCPHVKLATELLEPRPRAKRTRSGKRTIARWLDEMERGV